MSISTIVSLSSGGTPVGPSSECVRMCSDPVDIIQWPFLITACSCASACLLTWTSGPHTHRSILIFRCPNDGSAVPCAGPNVAVSNGMCVPTVQYATAASLAVCRFKPLSRVCETAVACWSAIFTQSSHALRSRDHSRPCCLAAPRYVTGLIVSVDRRLRMSHVSAMPPLCHIVVGSTVEHVETCFSHHESVFLPQNVQSVQQDLSGTVASLQGQLAAATSIIQTLVNTSASTPPPTPPVPPPPPPSVFDNMAWCVKTLCWQLTPPAGHLHICL